MLGSIARKIFGSANDRFLRTLHSQVAAINALEPELEKLTDSELQERTPWLQERLAKGETVDDILVDAFATVREASKRVMGMRHFDVQLIGGIVLHRGMISEMKTGEGKTLVATLPSYLNALSGKGVHVVTVNDYLASRDSAWMARLHNFLGLTVGCIIHDMEDHERKAAYAADITYGTNNEYGFDYLRDNMKFSREHMVQRPFNFAIVDEVDSILIDEARTPLIISGPTQDNSELYRRINTLMLNITEEDFEKDEKGKNVTLTEEGVHHVEAMLAETDILRPDTALYDIENVSVVHHVNQALKAHQLFTRDVDYIVKNDKVVIIDEFTGRMMEGRRYSEGLHQALEAKEGVTIQNENQTLASITFQNYFRLYPKLSGMTGTAMTEANEFGDIYNLEVIEIPTNVPVQRIDEDDAIYRSAAEKYEAIIERIVECNAKGQPILVGTVSIEKSEYLSEMLKKRKIPHKVLNARHHEQEAFIVAQAGVPGAVTIATNMAGRGTDIMLGGNPDMRIAHETADLTDENEIASRSQAIRAEVKEHKQQALDAGGLFVLATERHESRRIDNQLRGRSGRQGDPGHTMFYLSTEDDLMRIFGGDRMNAMLEKLGMPQGEAINHPWLNRAIEKAQEKVEARNYEIRKNLLKFDDVMNDQRKVIYDQRIEIMESEEDVAEIVRDMREDINEILIERHMPEKSYAEQWDVEGLEKEIFRIYGLHLPIAEWAKEEGVANEEILERLRGVTNMLMEDKEKEFGPELMRVAEKRLLLQTLDELWKDHLLSLDHLRHGIHLRAFGQRDPLNEYKQEAFNMFEWMLNHMREAVTQRLSRIRLRIESMESMSEEPQQEMHESRADPAMAAEAAPMPAQLPEGMRLATVRNAVAPENRDPNDPATWGKIGRNEECPCGSGKKFKHCHGVIA